MRDRIMKKLDEIEKTEGIRILLAVESGSRAWGFASTDSDYDVRFIYIRPRDFYLKLESTRDVIEIPIEGAFDINGWDLNKTLRLAYKSNPTLFEWSSSPVVYRDLNFCHRFRPILESYFSPRNGINHYLHMAKGTFYSYLREALVPVKKYFYALRPILACFWILERGTPPPMSFRDLAEGQLERGMMPLVKKLLEIKVNAPEVKRIPRIDRLNEYIEKHLAEIEEKLGAIPEGGRADWAVLNNFFLSEVENQWS